MSKDWYDRAQELIARESYVAWRQANVKKDGSRYKRHRSYVIPDWCEMLVELCGANDEKGAKRLMMRQHILGFGGVDRNVKGK